MNYSTTEDQSALEMLDSIEKTRPTLFDELTGASKDSEIE